MISNILDRISFWSLFIVIVLLPIFFLPFVKIPVETTKGLFLVIGLAISIIFWTAARFSGGKIVIPRSSILLAGLGVVFSFFVSALFSTASKMSFFGIMFDVGTFWFVFAAFLLMLVSSMVLKDKKRARIVLLGTVLSFGVIFIFQMFRIMAPNTLSFGILGGKTDNIFGTWNALGIFAGFSAIVSLFLIEFFSISKKLKWVLSILIIFSLSMIAITNFSFIWEILGVFALILFIYKISLYASESHREDRNKHFPTVSLIIVMISLLFFILGQVIGGFLPNHLGISNIEISPSLATTMHVTKGALSKDPILGIGPNLFSEVWSMYKPSSINGTQFWNTSFNSGSGSLPTFISTTGSLGVIAWIIFLALLIMLGVKAFSSGIKNNTTQESLIFFIAAIYLFIASFFYSTGAVIFLLAFAFSGIFVGITFANSENGEIEISFLDDPRKSFFSILFLALVMIITAATAFKFIERFASVSYFGKAISAQTVPIAESNINKAISLYQNDLYFRTYSQVYLVKINQIISKGAQTISDDDKATLKTSINAAISGANSAVAYNAHNYLNLSTLGSVYETIAPFGIDGAYDKAVDAYTKAGALNPLNPSISLSLARVSFTNGKTKEATDYANQALKLKADYVDPLILLSQISKSQGDMTSAVNYAQRALSLYPTDQSLIQYVNSLKNGGSNSTDIKNTNSSEGVSNKNSKKTQ